MSMVAACSSADLCSVTPSENDLCFDAAAQTWDEGMPLGNAVVGALIWNKNDALRMSLDRVDLWDLRPSDSLSGDNYRFEWVKEHIRKGDYEPVQKKFDWPYDMLPAPSKIPGAAIEFSLEKLGRPSSVNLYLNDALCEVKWETGAVMQTFVHADKPVGWFVFKNLEVEVEPELIAPQYDSDNSGIRRLGYDQGKIKKDTGCLSYHQKGYGDFYYDVVVRWKKKGKTLVGTWSVSSSLCEEKAESETLEAMKRGIQNDYSTHSSFWKKYWSMSSVQLPDAVLQKQYYNEMYKFGSVARENAYTISLQAVWTADNGQLPPWKGDFHHDLNTQLSYWPAYTGNHLEEGLGYLNTLWNQREAYKTYTRQYFETGGMNVPGVCTLTGEPMGGWIQYAMSQTVGAWLAQHFYLHWKYSADQKFLETRAYPFAKDVAIFLEQISRLGSDGKRRLEFSSSPEIFDNSVQAWFPDMTNYDLALMHFIFSASSEMAGKLGMEDEAAHWRVLESQLPDYDLDEDGALTFAKGHPYNVSHRHFSNALAIHPLGLIDWSKGEKDRNIIKATLKKLHDNGPDWWCGYSYAWYANMAARAFDGETAADALRTFAECFCLRNTFHANGDQTASGKSKFTYRPFTLEGNFAFAAGIHEMLLQSHTGTIKVFPAIPAAWNNVSFDELRAVGAFLVSAKKENGKVVEFTVYSEKGGHLAVESPIDGKILEYETHPGEMIDIIRENKNR